MRTHADIVIVGGGPAGAIAARLLVQRGASVIVLDRRREGEGKTCGHCLSPRGVNILRDMQLLDHVRHASYGKTNAVDIAFASDRRWRMSFPEEAGLGLLVRRGTFDDALIDAATRVGASVRRATRVVDVQQHPRMAIVTARSHASPENTYEITTPLVVGADGLRSIVAQRFIPAQRAPRCRSIGFAFDVSHNEHATCVPRGTIMMHVIEAGYLGVVRSESLMHVGGYIRGGAVRPSGRDSRRAPPRGSVQSFLQACVATFPALNEIIPPPDDMPRMLSNLSACGPMPQQLRRVATSRAALVGDAAGYVEPFTGEGMAWAIESAKLFADAFHRANSVWDERAQRDYTLRWRRVIGRGHRRCRWVGRVIRMVRPIVAGSTFGLTLLDASHDQLNRLSASILRRHAEATP